MASSSAHHGTDFYVIIFFTFSRILNDFLHDKFIDSWSFFTTLSTSPVSLVCVANLLFRLATSSVFPFEISLRQVLSNFGLMCCSFFLYDVSKTVVDVLGYLFSFVS